MATQGTITEISSTTSTLHEFRQALKGTWGSGTLSNGVTWVKAGRLVTFSGIFTSSPDTIQIPVVAARIPVFFAGTSGECKVSIAEPGNGFVRVPSTIKATANFTMTGTGLLNSD